MANPEQVELLKNGVGAWNEYRQKQDAEHPDLSGAELTDRDLRRAMLNGADLSEANLSGSDLSEAQLVYANVCGAVLGCVKGGWTRAASLVGADLTRSGLAEADLTGANLAGADLTDAVFGATILVNIDLSEVTGLDTVQHKGPSSIGLDTFYASRGHIPEGFLRLSGVPDEVIEFLLPLVREGPQLK